MPHYLIDGYNLLYALPDIPPGPWPTKREILIELLLTSQPQGNNKITVVFDSREGSGNKSHKGPVEIIFTASETADDWIIRRVREVSQPRALTVVSNDKGIRLLIKGTGAKWITTEEFMGQGKQPGKKPQREERTPIDTDSITEEFTKKWL